jgi:hypothetical protein
MSTRLEAIPDGEELGLDMIRYGNPPAGTSWTPSQGFNRSLTERPPKSFRSAPLAGVANSNDYQSRPFRGDLWVQDIETGLGTPVVP